MEGRVNRQTRLPDSIEALRSMQDGHRILVVDDSRLIRVQESRILEKSGFEVKVAENGAVALEKVLAFRPHLILMDINMPVMNGWGTLQALKKLDGASDIPVVILSSNGQESYRRTARAWGAHSLLAKPVRSNQLVEHIYTVLLSSSEEPEKKSLRDCSILVIDESSLIRRRNMNAVSVTGCKVFEAENGGDAILVARSNVPDIILLDIDMTDINGWEFTQLIRADETLSHVLIIGITGSGQRKDIAKAIHLGMSDYMVKPFTSGQLLERVLRLLETVAHKEEIEAIKIPE